MKKRGRGLTIRINLSNRWLYTFIFLGILIIICVGVYAAYPASGAGHNANEIDFSGANVIGATVVRTAEVQSAKSGQNIYDVAANNIGADTSIYSYGSICSGNSAGDCSGTGGSVITSTQISTPKLCLGTDCKTSWPAVVPSGGLYGYCQGGYFGGKWNCPVVKSPATCTLTFGCACPSTGYEKVSLGLESFGFFACYKT